MSTDDIDETFRELRARSELFDDTFGGLAPSEIGVGTERAIRSQWRAIILAARKLRTWVMETRAIPRGKAKRVEMAYRAFDIRRPRDYLAWWGKNRRHVTTLLEAQDWPDRSDDAEDLYEVGPLTVHDTLHMSTSERERTLDVVASAVEAIEGADPGLARVLYGPVYVVGRLHSPTHLAWYYPKKDAVYLRPQAGDTEAEAFNLIHELGHRYWTIAARPEDQKAWVAHHNDLARTRVDVPTPRAGDRVPVAGYDEPLEIAEIKYLRGLRGPQAMVFLDPESEIATGRIPLLSIVRTREREQLSSHFPTIYAMTDPEEHFAESFAMYALGTLPSDHVHFFQDWLDQAESHGSLAHG